MAAGSIDFEVKKPVESVALVHTPTPMDLLQIAVSNDMSIEKLAQLMELQLKWEANEARKAFVSALNSFKADTPVLEKVKRVDFSSKSGNRVNYSYAPLDHVSKLLAEALSKQGLSFRWNVQQGESVTVTCILQHCQGHTESVSLTAALHNDDRMNPIQRLGSTITYLERYTLLAATGVATQDQDDDATDTQGLDDVSERVEFIQNCRDFDELKRVFKSHYVAAKEAKDNRAEKQIAAAYEARKREINANH